MPKTKRQHNRVAVDYEVVFYWEDATGQVHSARPRARDTSNSGMRVESAVPIECGIDVCVEVPHYGVALEASVRYCVPEGNGFRIGVQFTSPNTQPADFGNGDIDYYEVLQLSQKADLETIHRVYRIMAARFHPDNPDSGNQERFLLLSEAYRILCDPFRRAQYDQFRATETRRPLPLFQSRAYVDEKEGEMNRRLGVLCLLYAQRKRTPDKPSIGLIELEELMSIPREYLEFTFWYLKQKRYVEMSSSADFCLTADGVDFVEEHAKARDILVRLLTNGGSKDDDPLRSRDFAPSQGA